MSYTATSEKIDHPAHYGGAENPYEAIKVIEHLGLGPGFCKGNALKYLMRAGKARWYLDRAIAQLEPPREGA